MILLANCHVKRLSASLKEPEDGTKCLGFDTCIWQLDSYPITRSLLFKDIFNKEKANKQANKTKQNPERHGQNFILRRERWNKDDTIFCLANIQMQYNWIWVQNGNSICSTEGSGILGADFFQPRLSEGLKKAGRCVVILTTVGTAAMRGKLNLHWLIFTNPSQPGRVPLLSVTGISLFPLRNDLRLLQNSEQLCNVKKRRDCTKCKEKAE